MATTDRGLLDTARRRLESRAPPRPGSPPPPPPLSARARGPSWFLGENASLTRRPSGRGKNEARQRRWDRSHAGGDRDRHARTAPRRAAPSVLGRATYVRLPSVGCRIK